MSQLVLNPSVHSVFPDMGNKERLWASYLLSGERLGRVLGNRAHVLLRLCRVSGVVPKDQEG